MPSLRSPRRVFAPLLTLLFLTSAPAILAGQSVEAEAAREAGRRALADGRPDAAARAFLRSLELVPDDRATLGLLLEAAADDPDARALWSQELWSLALDEEGRGEPTPRERRLLPDDDDPAARVARTRLRAAQELLELAAAREEAAERDPEERLVARWARRTGLLLAEGLPALRAADGLEPTLSDDPDAHDPVVKALQRELKSALGQREAGMAARLARRLQALAAQARFDDLQGPKPRGMERVGRSAAEALARARELLRDGAEAPWTVDDLEWLTEEEGEAFTRQHATWEDPGVALSPNGWYRVETVCGHGTLLGAAATVEDHHRRLARWYGVDPFRETGPRPTTGDEGPRRLGTVRIVPEAHGLEAEGAPFWWAGGFQGGDTTTLRFSKSTIEGLGRGLTHELTHRFDGALFPGQPAWMTEGKAVWTAAAYGHSSDEEFASDHASVGTIEAAFVKGYGGEAKLRALVTGELEDYRDNYTAGYALYVFLDSWREGEGERLFRARVRPFLESAAKGARDRQGHFEQHFCDGEDGRPESFEAFAALFGTYLRGFYWKSREPWVEWYVTKLEGGPDEGLVYDEPTWGWARDRAEPVFGQDQLREAGWLLLERGKRAAAEGAFVAGLARDGRTPEVERRLAELLERRGRDAPAWALRALLAFPGRPQEPAPFLARLPAVRAHLAALEQAVETHLGAGRPLAAAALAADHERLSRRLGTPVSEATVAAPAPGPIEALRHPFVAPALPLGLEGWGEEGLVGYEERRVEGLWYAGEDGSLTVGAKRPRRNTGATDRTAHQRQAFTRSELRLLPGTYRVRARIAFSTSYVAGQVVLGFERRDRSLRFGFNAGDFLYAIGESEEEPAFESLGWSLRGGRERDGPLGGSRPGGTLEFDARRSSFALELLVDGPAFEARVDGVLVGRYHTVDGAPIEGRVGFASSMGAYQVREASVQRLDRAALAQAPGAPALLVDLDRVALPDFLDLRNRSLRGLVPPTNGVFLLWIHAARREEGEPFDATRPVSRAESGVRDLVRQLRRAGLPQDVVVALPEAVPAEGLDALRATLAGDEDLTGDRTVTLRTHRLDGLLAEDEEAPDRSKRWLLFVDGRSIVRAARPFLTQLEGLDGRFLRWAQAFRDHGRPERALPPALRAPDESGEGSEQDG